MPFERFSRVRNIAQAIFANEFSCFDQKDALFVDIAMPQVSISYICASASNVSGESTYINCRIHTDSNEIWIRSIRVASSFQGQGLGRQLAQAAEAIARCFNIDVIKIMPLTSSLEFWRKLGYTPEPHAARVMSKILTDVATVADV